MLIVRDEEGRIVLDGNTPLFHANTANTVTEPGLYTVPVNSELPVFIGLRSGGAEIADVVFNDSCSEILSATVRVYETPCEFVLIGSPGLPMDDKNNGIRLRDSRGRLLLDSDRAIAKLEHITERRFGYGLLRNRSIDPPAMSHDFNSDKDIWLSENIMYPLEGRRTGTGYYTPTYPYLSLETYVDVREGEYVVLFWGGASFNYFLRRFDTGASWNLYAAPMVKNGRLWFRPGYRVYDFPADGSFIEVASATYSTITMTFTL